MSRGKVTVMTLYHHHHHCVPSVQHILLSWPIPSLCPSQWKYSLSRLNISTRYKSLMLQYFAASRLKQRIFSNIIYLIVSHTVVLFGCI